MQLHELECKVDSLLANEPRRIYIEFLDPEIVPLLEGIGFNVVSQFVDFWNEDISIFETNKEIRNSKTEGSALN